MHLGLVMRLPLLCSEQNLEDETRPKSLYLYCKSPTTITTYSSYEKWLKYFLSDVFKSVGRALSNLCIDRRMTEMSS